MKTTFSRLLMVSGALAAPLVVMAQGPGGGGNRANPSDVVARMMRFDANGDGRLTAAEVTDERLRGLFARADANGDGAVTKDELTTLFTQEGSTIQRGGPGGPGGFGGPGGTGGPGGFGGPPQPGQILPGFMQQQLNLTDAQRQALAHLQRDVDTRLAQILTPAQLQQLQFGANRGPVGPGGANAFGQGRQGGFGPGGPGRPGGFGQGGAGGPGFQGGQGGPPPGGFGQGGAGRSRGNRPPNAR